MDRYRVPDLPIIARLRIKNGDRLWVQDLSRPIYSIGRSSDCDIVIANKFISRVHGTLVWRYNHGQPYYQLIDGTRDANKPSSNGIFINDRKVISIWERLKDGDVISFGGSDVTICYMSLQSDYFAFRNQLDEDSKKTLEGDEATK